jgi:hypothetical protein
MTTRQTNTERATRAPGTVWVLYAITFVGGMFPAFCLAAPACMAVFYVPIMLLTGGMSWGEFFSLLIASLVVAIYLGVVIFIHFEMNQVIAAYNLIEDIYRHLTYKDPDDLTIAERTLLQFHHTRSYQKNSLSG